MGSLSSEPSLVLSVPHGGDTAAGLVAGGRRRPNTRLGLRIPAGQGMRFQMNDPVLLTTQVPGSGKTPGHCFRDGVRPHLTNPVCTERSAPSYQDTRCVLSQGTVCKACGRLNSSAWHLAKPNHFRRSVCRALDYPPSPDQGAEPTDGLFSLSSQSCEYFLMTTRSRTKSLRMNSFGLTQRRTQGARWGDG